MGHLGVSWRRLGASWRRLGGILGHLGGVLGPLGGVLETSWRHLGISWRCLGASGRCLGGVLGRLGGVLEASWGILKVSWRIFEKHCKPMKITCFLRFLVIPEGVQGVGSTALEYRLGAREKSLFHEKSLKTIVFFRFLGCWGVCGPL